MQHGDWCARVACLLASDLATGNDCCDGRRSYRLALFVDYEAAVGIAVEGKTNVCAVFNHCALQVDEILWVKWVCFVIRKSSVELEIHRHDG